MRVLIVGKWPPIQGGVSAGTYFTAMHLSHRDVVVDVLTNADCVKSGYRQRFVDNDQDIAQIKSVTVHNISTSEPFHIPHSSAFESKMFGAGLSLIREATYDLIYGYYMQPYGLVAAQLAYTSGIPLLLRHAGSDIGRLAGDRCLAEAYRWAFKTASKVLTGNCAPESELFRSLSQLGVNPTLLEQIPAASMPKGLALRQAPLSLMSLPTSDILSNDQRISEGWGMDFDPINVTIGIYGKVGHSKGTYDLINALSILSNTGLQFNFAIIPVGSDYSRQNVLNEISRSCERLRRRTLLIAPLAPWRVGGFVRACDAVCFLEHRFPIEFHTSRVPREVLLSGSCLVCSAEMADKMFFKESLVDGMNYFRIQDPKDHSDLSDKLRNIILSPQLRRRVSYAGSRMMMSWEAMLPQADGTGRIIMDMLTTGQKHD